MLASHTQKALPLEGHIAGKAKAGARHAVLAFDKPTLAREAGSVSSDYRHCSEALQDWLDGSHPDGLSAGADEGVSSMFSPVLANDIRSV